jgi:hypothetical protein
MANYYYVSYGYYEDVLNKKHFRHAWGITENLVGFIIGQLTFNKQVPIIFATVEISQEQARQLSFYAEDD